MKTAEHYSDLINSRKHKYLYICDGHGCTSFKDNCFKKGGGCVHTTKKKHSLKKKLGDKFPPTRFVEVNNELLVEEVDLAEFVNFFV